jgi:hypothetical protein
MMLVFNLSRSYGGLDFRVAVPGGSQGYILEVVERKTVVR